MLLLRSALDTAVIWPQVSEEEVGKLRQDIHFLLRMLPNLPSAPGNSEGKPTDRCVWLRRGDPHVSMRKHRDALAALAATKYLGVESAASADALWALRGELSALQTKQRVTAAVTGFGHQGSASASSVLADFLPDLDDDALESLEKRVTTEVVEQAASGPPESKMQRFQRFRGAMRATDKARRNIGSVAPRSPSQVF